MNDDEQDFVGSMNRIHLYGIRKTMKCYESLMDAILEIVNNYDGQEQVDLICEAVYRQYMTLVSICEADREIKFINKIEELTISDLFDINESEEEE